MKIIAHKLGCAFLDQSIPYHSRKLDPTCPRCAYKIKHAAWPKHPARDIRRAGAA
jgi:hypothetical protein